MAAPVQLAAIDAGSNAIRLVIARATSPQHIQVLETERASVRLGHNAFTRRLLDDETISQAARTFRQFRERMDRFHTGEYRAVATAAAREVRNHRELIERIRRKSGLEIEIISSAEEARLVCSAVHGVLGERVRPRLIFDLGGGSLEMNFFRQGVLDNRIALPLGTIRIMETHRIRGAITEDVAERLRHHVLSLLRSAMPSPPPLKRSVVVACGGNAEALVRFAPAPNFGRIPAINVRLLRDQTWRLLHLDVPGRMRQFHIRQDRAEVIGIAAIIISSVAKWLGLQTMLVPGVGVREGILLDLVARQYSAAIPKEEQEQTAELLAGAHWFARKLGTDLGHGEQVSRLALSLFDQLRPLHEMGPELRVVLGVAALLHDVGHFVNRKAHHRHGEYLIRNGEIPALRGWRQDMVAALVRYHNCKSEPDLEHVSYAALEGQQRRQTRVLSALLRIAEKLESEHAAGIQEVDLQVSGRRAIFVVRVSDGTRLDIAGLERKAGLFEKEFQLRPEFRRAQRKEKVA